MNINGQNRQQGRSAKWQRRDTAADREAVDTIASTKD